jgi:phenylalanyl-tRNA synthetase beta chain
MKLSLRWLRDWIEPGEDPGALAARMTEIGLAVDAIEDLGRSIRDVVVARVDGVERHPNADRLSLCTVFDGRGTHRVVCGAPNVRAGGRYPFAGIGTALPGGLTIRAATIRGERSEGMLCSAKELGLSEDASGLLELDDHLPPGMPLAEALGRADVVFEIDVPYNRPDWLSVRGIARELSAALACPVHPPDLAIAERGAPAEAAVRVTVTDAVGCPLYGARVIRGVRVGPSPEWLRSRLEAIGQRSINNVVDVTNYVLHTFGQPTHAFDLATVGAAVHVRRAAAGETLTTLDGVLRALTPDVLVIADRDRAIALAGIMGGKETEVTERTTDILLEGAWFDPRTVRDGARRLGMATDASTRFGRGVDRGEVIAALAAAGHWIADVSGGALAPGVVCVGEPTAEPRSLALRLGSADRLLGESIPGDEVVSILGRLSLDPKQEGDRVHVQVPSWRGDIEREEDLIEEIARYHGYNRFSDRNQNANGVAATRSSAERWMERSVAAMLGLGFQEVQTHTLLPAEEALRAGEGAEGPITLATLLNAKSREAAVLRPALWISEVPVARRNLRRGVERFRFFEHGKTFRVLDGSSAPRYDERWELAGMACGDLVPGGWTSANVPMDLFTLKGIVNAWFEALSLRVPDFAPLSRPLPPFDRSLACRFENPDGITGNLGAFDGKLARELDLPATLWVFSVDFEKCLKLDEVTPCYHEPSRFPAVKRDLAFVVEKRVSHAELEERLRADGKGLVRSVRLFDVYEGPPVPSGKRSLAFSLVFQSGERSLQNDEVDALVAGLIEQLRVEFGASLRDV